MDDKELIEWLEREGAINIQTNARPHFKAAASRLRELVAENKAWRLVDSESRDAHPCPDLALRAEYRRRARELAKKNDATKEPTP